MVEFNPNQQNILASNPGATSLGGGNLPLSSSVGNSSMIPQEAKLSGVKQPNEFWVDKARQWLLQGYKSANQTWEKTKWSQSVDKRHINFAATKLALEKKLPKGTTESSSSDTGLAKVLPKSFNAESLNQSWMAASKTLQTYPFFNRVMKAWTDFEYYCEPKSRIDKSHIDFKKTASLLQQKL